MKWEFYLLGAAWLLSLLQYQWFLGKDDRGEVRRRELLRTPMAEWVTGNMLLVTCHSGDSGIEKLLDAVVDPLKLSGVILEKSCQKAGVRPAAVSRYLRTRFSHTPPKLAVHFSPFLSQEDAASVVDLSTIRPASGLLDQGKIFTWEGEKGYLLDFSSPVGKQWVRQHLEKLLLRQGVDALWCEPADSVLIGRHEEAEDAIVASSQYSASYYWTVFDVGRELRGVDFVVMGAGVGRYPRGASADSAPMPRDVGFVAVGRMLGGGGEGSEEERTVHALREGARVGYVGLAAAPVPIPTQLQVSAYLSTLVLVADASSAPSVLGDNHFLTKTALHAELSPYLLSSTAAAFQQRRSLVSFPDAGGGFYLGPDLWVRLEAGALPPGGGRWFNAVSRDFSGVSPNGVLLKRAGAGLVVRPRLTPGNPFSPLLWSQYGVQAPAKAVLTVVFDGVGGRLLSTSVHADTSPACLQVNVTSALRITVTPYKDPLLLVLRAFNTPLPQGAWVSHPYVGSLPAFPSLHSIREGLADPQPSLAYYYNPADSEIFLLVPAAPMGTTLQVQAGG